jgi:hypothetical protein
MELHASRKLLKSEPELRELVALVPAVSAGQVRVEFAEEGFGTKVTLAAVAGIELEIAQLEQILDTLAEPQKRPFSAS